MNNLPLSPDDVTEFTCEGAADFEKQYLAHGRRGLRYPEVDDLHELAIAAEWAHRIARSVADAEFSITPETYASAYAYVAWLDSLKGGQNG